MPVLASYTLKLEGVDDDKAVEAVTALLKAMDGVSQVAYNADSKTATITMNRGKTLSEDALKAAFKDTKYTFKDFAKAS